DAAGRRDAVDVADGGVDDHLAGDGRRLLGVDGDLVTDRRVGAKQVVAAGLWQRVVGAVQQRPGLAAVHRAQDADADLGGLADRRVLAAGTRVAGGGEDDRLVRVAVARVQRDVADVQAEGRAEVQQRPPRRAGGVGGQEVVGLPDAAAGRADED